MRFVYNRKLNTWSKISKQCCMALVLCILFGCFLTFTSYALESNSSSKVVRVGFFEFEGYHETDEKNRRSGYGYEYLHEMAKYTGWVFEYVDGTWEECQEMLKNGEIDLLTSAQYSEGRDVVFDFSETSMGTSYAQLTVSEGNTQYGRNDFAKFDGINVGLLKGNSRNDRLAEFAEEKGFTYTSNMYENQEELGQALKTGAVDAVLTSSLRKLSDETIIAQFAPSPFYAIVKEGNQELLQEVDGALEAIEMNSPAFRYNLYQEFYGADTCDTFVLSQEEKEYLETKPTIRAVIRPGLAPISYCENEEFKGISADVMEYLLSDLNIKIEYICTDSLEEGYEMLENDSADIACLFESDYNLAEQHDIRITTPYLRTNYSVISRQQGNQDAEARRIIAIMEGDFFALNYSKSHYPQAEFLPVKTSEEALASVSKGGSDFALVNVYSAEEEIANYTNLRASFISDADQQFSIGVSHNMDARLYSILDKKISTMDSQIFNDILAEHTMFQHGPLSLAAYLRQHPTEVLLASITVFSAIIGILLYIIMNNRRHAKKIYNLAYVDPLTTLWNVNGFLLQGNQTITKNPKDLFAVITTDLSKFSGINEDYGRQVGDQVIAEMGVILQRFVNEQTVVAHGDADHFLLLLKYKEREDLHNMLVDIVGKLSYYKIENLQIRCNVYVGVGFVEQKTEALLQAVDYASLARNQCSLEQPIVYMDTVLHGRLLREKEICDNVESALAQEEFQVYYQPKIDMSSKEIFGAEALIRWNHSKLGFLSPGEFLPILEQSGLITEVDFFVLEQVCKLVRKWIDAGQKPIIISVNQSRANFLKSNYIQRLQDMMIRYNIPEKLIELEITETLFGQEAISNELIKQMKSLGFLISIDDFGSGYSSLHLLHQISIDILKIDKSLLDESGKEEKMRNIIHRVVQIATDLNVEVICEGVETKEQAEFLMRINCKYAQGFLFSKPLPQPEFELLIRDGKQL